MTDATSQTPSTESTQGPIADPPPGDVRPRGRVAAATRAWGEAEGIPVGDIPLNDGHLTIQDPEGRLWFAYQAFQRDEGGSPIVSGWSFLLSEPVVREVSAPPPGDRAILGQARPAFAYPDGIGAEGPREPRSNRLIKALNLAVDECARALIERDEALAERDRARATAVRLEQELAEMTEAASGRSGVWRYERGINSPGPGPGSVAIGMALVSQAREAELQDGVTELIASAKEALPWLTARDREGRE